MPCPKILSIKVDHDQVRPGAAIHATLETANPSGHPLSAKWVLTVDPARYITGGEFSRAARVIDNAITGGDLNGADVQMPSELGPYWLYAHVRDDAGGAATAVVPLDAADPSSAAAGRPVSLPFKVYASDLVDPPFAWSGWMGDNGSVALDLRCADNPHSGSTCMKLQFKSPNGFGGIAAQNPPERSGATSRAGIISPARDQADVLGRGEEGERTCRSSLASSAATKNIPILIMPSFPMFSSPKIEAVSSDRSFRGRTPGAHQDRVCVGSGRQRQTRVTFYLDADIQYE